MPVLSTSEFSLSIPSRTRPCEASALTRPPKRCYRGRRRLHAGKCHGQGAVPCPLAGAARTAEAQPLLLADDARGRGPPLSQGASAGGGSFSGKSASLFGASFSFSRPLKVGAPWGPALGPASCRNSPGTAGCHAFHFPRDARGSQLPCPALPVLRAALHGASLRATPFDPLPLPSRAMSLPPRLAGRRRRHRGKAS